MKEYKGIVSALIITLLFMIIEIIGGWLTNSMALIADAGHMLTDVGALSISVLGLWLSRTRNNHRYESMAGLINGCTLLIMCFWLLRENFYRWFSPEEVKGLGLTLISLLGLSVNLISYKFLSHSHSGHCHDHNHHHNINTLGAKLHVLGDALGSVVGIIAGLCITFWGINWVDTIGSFIILSIISTLSVRLVFKAASALLKD
ncbi:MAG: cation diffusion facilitator family transporter [Candidatus Doudnabacteria bacterium]